MKAVTVKVTNMEEGGKVNVTPATAADRNSDDR